MTWFELIRVFLPDTSNEARLTDQLTATSTRLSSWVSAPHESRCGQPAVFEVRRILKAFVDAQWLADFDARLLAYKAQLDDADRVGNDV